MSAEGAFLDNPGRFELNHGGSSKSSDLRQPRRNSEDKRSASTHQLSLLSTLANQQEASGGAIDDTMAAATAEVAKIFNFERVSRSSATNETQQQGSASHAPLSPQLPRTGRAPFLVARPSRQFIPQKTSKEYAPVQEEESRTVAKPEKPRKETLSHSTHPEAQGAQPDAAYGGGQPSSSFQEVPFHAVPSRLFSSTPDACGFPLQNSSSNQAAYRIGIPSEHSEDPYEDNRTVDSDHELHDQEGDFGDYYMNEEPAAYFRSSKEREFERAPGPNEEDTKLTDPVPSQDPPPAVSPTSGFSAGFTAQFADYVRTHQQEAQDAEERWKNATIEEWKAGKYGEWKFLVIYMDADGGSRDDRAHEEDRGPCEPSFQTLVHHVPIRFPPLYRPRIT